MTKQLWSISAIAVETGRDRRTVAKALNGVPADGAIDGGHSGWHLSTALAALAALDGPARSRNGLAEGLLGNFLDRAANWREIDAERVPVSWSIEGAAEALGVPVARVLLWLRCGCPYLTPGDFATGAGFRLRPSWVIEWVAMASALADRCGKRDVARQLGLWTEFRNDPLRPVQSRSP
jgi:hypothetical protein